MISCDLKKEKKNKTKQVGALIILMGKLSHKEMNHPSLLNQLWNLDSDRA